MQSQSGNPGNIVTSNSSLNGTPNTVRPASVVTDHERTRLAHAGVNTLVAVRSSGKSSANQRTLAAGSSGSPDWKYLSARRLALFITASKSLYGLRMRVRGVGSQ